MELRLYILAWVLSPFFKLVPAIIPYNPGLSMLVSETVFRKLEVPRTFHSYILVTLGLLKTDQNNIAQYSL